MKSHGLKNRDKTSGKTKGDKKPNRKRRKDNKTLSEKERIKGKQL
jgi:hypothetical protein